MRWNVVRDVVVVVVFVSHTNTAGNLLVLWGWIPAGLIPSYNSTSPSATVRSIFSFDHCWCFNVKLGPCLGSFVKGTDCASKNGRVSKYCILLRKTRKINSKHAEYISAEGGKAFNIYLSLVFCYFVLPLTPLVNQDKIKFCTVCYGSCSN